MKKRPYRLRQRAIQQQETRERIVDAAVALHEEIGPAATTISALAERAGVQRLTVYRHFATEQEIFRACSAKWLAQHGPPQAAGLPPGPPAARTRAILAALYAYYDGTQGMLRSLYRDVGRVEGLDVEMREFEAQVATLGEALLAACAPARSKALRTTIGHALRFSTWQSLHEQGLGGAAMAALVAGWIEAASDGRRGAL